MDLKFWSSLFDMAVWLVVVLQVSRHLVALINGYGAIIDTQIMSVFPL